MLYRYMYIGGLMGYTYTYINIFPKKLQFAAYKQFVLVFFRNKTTLCTFNSSLSQLVTHVLTRVWV